VAKSIQILALFIGIFTYLFWDVVLEKFDIPIFYIGNALCTFLVPQPIKKNSKIIAIIVDVNNERFSFLLLCLSFGNLMDELFFSNTETCTSEIIIALILPIIWFIKIKWHARQTTSK